MMTVNVEEAALSSYMPPCTTTWRQRHLACSDQGGLKHSPIELDMLDMAAGYLRLPDMSSSRC
jgi:hypothetical protein